MELVNILFILVGFLSTLLILGVIAILIFLVYNARNNKKTESEITLKEIKDQIRPEDYYNTPPEIEEVPKIPVKQVPKEEEPQMDLEKELKKYPRKQRKQLRALYEQYNKGNIIKVEGKNGEVSR